MTADSITVVTGLPRSGTTMLMRMLEAGGVPLYYDNSRPMFFEENGRQCISYNAMLRETEKSPDLRDGESEWLNECYGKAVKILNPAKVMIPKGHKYNFIWCSRRVKDLVRSQFKWWQAIGKPRTDDPQRTIASAEIARSEGLAALKKYPKSRLMVVEFKDAITKPRAVAIRLARWLGRDMDTEAMAAVVVKRPAAVMPDMMEERIYSA